MTSADAVDRGRDAFARGAWGDAYAALAAADREAAAGAEDLERLATAAYLLGRDDEGDDLLARAHQEFLRRGDVERAARSAARLGLQLFFRGEPARSGGWLARACRLLDDAGLDSVARGYLLVPAAVRCVEGGDPAAGYDTFAQAAGIGERFGDADLVAFARHGQGRALLRLGRIDDGVALLDEAMVAVTAGEVSPALAGAIYCSVVSACHEIFDLRRAQEWTEALGRWCESQPDVVA
ncbi:MAG TPA: hypothetical protein VFQ38_11505, partial [Longimicrobiales bacterium]|nr:hypothetical protein [Longimicrobiales bacterium]